MLPSDHWKTVQELEADEDLSVSVWRTLRDRLDLVRDMVARLRPPHQCTVNRTKYAAGTTSIAIEVVFDDGVPWIFRVRTDHIPDNDYSPDMVTKRLSSEIATLKLIRERTTIPVPTVFAYCTTSDNPLGFPYVVMSALLGRLPSDVGIPFSDPVAPDKLHVLERYCASLADIHLQLSKVRADRIGSIYIDRSSTSIGPIGGTGIGPFDSASAYFDANAKRLLRLLAPDGHFKPTDEMHAFTFWLYRLLSADTAFGPHGAGPFVLTHTDLHLFNTLVDETGAIVGILDWESAAFLPLEIFATQAILFNNRLDRDFDYAKQKFEQYDKALFRAEQQAPMTLPGDRASLTQLHASVSCRILGYLHYNHIGYDDFGGEHWPKALCRHLFGSDDWRAAMRSTAFQEWFSAHLR